MKFNIIALDNEAAVASSLDSAEYPRNLLTLIPNDKNMPACDAVVFLCGKAHKELFTALQSAFLSRPTVSAFALRTLPKDFCGYMDLPSLKIFCLEDNFAVKSSMLRDINGIDSKMQPCLSADLSRRILSFGGEMFYLPNALVYARDNAEDLAQYTRKNIGDLLLSCKFSQFKHILRNTAQYASKIKNPVHFDGVRKALVKDFASNIPRLFSAFFWRFSHFSAYKNAQLANTGFGTCRQPSFLTDLVVNATKISVLIRTHNRPDSLRETLKSLRYSTYKNYEIVIVEDGAPTSEALVKTEFADLPINYTSTGENVGRSKAGNLAISLAKSEYCNFLDDDDFFYPDHLELIAEIAAKNSAAQLIFGSADVLYANKKSDPYHLEKRRLMPLFFDKINAFTLCQRGQIPIQSACFKKELFTLYGGLDERLNCNEDWAMWLKYIAHAVRAAQDTPDIMRAGSVFVLPADCDDVATREGTFKTDEKLLFSDKSIEFTLNISDMRKAYYGVLQDVEHLYQQGLLPQFLQDTKAAYEKENNTDDKQL